METESYTVLCTYLVREERVADFEALLARHWPTLRHFGFVTDEPARIYFGRDSSGPFFTEILTWVDRRATGRAYWTPEINEIWNDFYNFTEDRESRPAIEYPEVDSPVVFAISAAVSSIAASQLGERQEQQPE